MGPLTLTLVAVLALVVTIRRAVSRERATQRQEIETVEWRREVDRLLAMKAKRAEERAARQRLDDFRAARRAAKPGHAGGNSAA